MALPPLLLGRENVEDDGWTGLDWKLGVGGLEAGLAGWDGCLNGLNLLIKLEKNPPWACAVDTSNKP